MSAEWRAAPEVAEIARQLIVRVLQHQPLVNVHIEYVFIAEAPKSRGRKILGRARKITGLNAWLGGPEGKSPGFQPGWPFFVIEISYDTWRDLDDNQRIALVDHELSHCAFDVDDEGAPVLSMRHHDVEEFTGVITRNGLWKADVQQLGVIAAEQLSLALDRIADHANTAGGA